MRSSDRLLRIALDQRHVIHLDVGRSVQRAAEKCRLDAQRPFQIEHVQSAAQHGDERAQRIVRRDDLARLWLGPYRQFVFAGQVGGVVEGDGQRNAVLRAVQIVRADDPHLAAGSLEQQLHRHVLVDQSVDAGVGQDRQLILHEHGLIDDQVLDRHVAGLSLPPRLAKRTGIQRKAEIGQSPGRGLRCDVARERKPAGHRRSAAPRPTAVCPPRSAALRRGPRRWRFAAPGACRADSRGSSPSSTGCKSASNV